MDNRKPRQRALAVTAALLAAGQLAAAEHFFVVQGAAYNPDFGSQPWSITMDGETLVAPADACGMVFEGDAKLHWYSDAFGLHDQIWIEFEEGKYAADVFLPGPGCGEWDGIKVEHVDQVNDNALASEYTPPHDFSGGLEADASGYWSDGGSPAQKLIYLHQPCHPMPGCLQGGQDFVVDGWSEGLHDPMRDLTRVLAAIHRGDSSAQSLLLQASGKLDSAVRAQEQRIEARRAFDTGSLEPSIRQFEDIARQRLHAARTDLAACSSLLRQGRRDAAYRQCNLALLGTGTARAVLHSADAWVVLRPR